MDGEQFRIPTEVNKTEEARQKRYPWGAPPPKVDEALIKETITTDVAVIGGGIAGLAAGARCTQLGLSVTVVEKYKGLVARGAHIASVGSDIQRAHGINIDKKQFARDWMRICGSRVNEDLLWLYINKSESAFDWIRAIGGDDITAFLFGGHYKGPDFTEYPGTHMIMKKPGSKRYKYYGGAMLMCEMLQNVILEGGNQIHRNNRAQYLEKDNDGRVVSFVALDSDGIYRRYAGKKGVILATGDIGGNPEMVAVFAPLGLKPARNGYFPPGLNTGDGHKMAYWAGAEYEAHNWALSLHLIGYAMYAFFFLHVNRQGKRYMNEDTWVQAKAIRTVEQPKGDWAYSVFDDRWLEQVRYLSAIGGGQFVESLGAMYGQGWSDSNGIKAAIDRYVENGLCAKADTIEELARKIDVPPDTFAATVKRYNEIYNMQDDVDYGKRTALLTPIDKPPYYALKFGPALLNVHGGVLTDTKMHVLDKEHNPIPGLYAVGNTAGGLYGVDYPLLLNGNSHTRAILWAKTAVEDIADSL